uniref:Uncharacterized protein n=1 Tax=Pithovirus LCPAC401 TaxID=2506595 RepID=A0A481Z996_9VIRU|nr:MAG: hypothetical protein LCPAC401_00150 [Pithovirus LCPAC401]
MGRTIITVHEILRGDMTYDKNEINHLVEYYGCPHHGFLFALIFAAGFSSILTAILLKDNSCLDSEYVLTPKLASAIYLLGIMLIGISSLNFIPDLEIENG